MSPKKSRGFFTYIMIFIIAGFCIYFISSMVSADTDEQDYTSVISHFDNYEVSYYELDLGSGVAPIGAICEVFGAVVKTIDILKTYRMIIIYNFEITLTYLFQHGIIRYEGNS